MKSKRLTDLFKGRKKSDPIVEQTTLQRGSSVESQLDINPAGRLTPRRSLSKVLRKGSAPALGEVKKLGIQPMENDALHNSLVMQRQLVLESVKSLLDTSELDCPQTMSKVIDEFLPLAKHCLEIRSQLPADEAASFDQYLVTRHPQHLAYSYFQLLFNTEEFSETDSRIAHLRSLLSGEHVQIHLTLNHIATMLEVRDAKHQETLFREDSFANAHSIAYLESTSEFLLTSIVQTFVDTCRKAPDWPEAYQLNSPRTTNHEQLGELIIQLTEFFNRVCNDRHLVDILQIRYHQVNSHGGFCPKTAEVTSLSFLWLHLLAPRIVNATLLNSDSMERPIFKIIIDVFNKTFSDTVISNSAYAEQLNAIIDTQLKPHVESLTQSCLRKLKAKFMFSMHRGWITWQPNESSGRTTAESGHLH